MNAWMSINSIEELEQHFPTEESCISFLFAMKWPRGFRCPQCQHSHAYVISTRRLPLYECCACRHQTSLIAHTIMEYSRTSLRKWILAIWLISRSEYKVNAINLSYMLQVTYKTAWLMFHKIRTIIHNVDHETPLEGIIQGIVSYHGQPLCRSILDIYPQENPLIVASSVSETGEMKAVKLKVVDRSHVAGMRLRPAAVQQFIDDHVCPFTVDRDTTINPLPFRMLSFSRQLKDCFRTAKRRIIDTYRGVGRKYLQLYLDEYSYRFNAGIRNEDVCDTWLDLAYMGMIRYERHSSFLQYRAYQSSPLLKMAA